MTDPEEAQALFESIEMDPLGLIELALAWANGKAKKLPTANLVDMILLDLSVQSARVLRSRDPDAKLPTKFVGFLTFARKEPYVGRNDMEEGLMALKTALEYGTVACEGPTALDLIAETFAWMDEKQYWPSPHVRAQDVLILIESVEAKARHELGSVELPQKFLAAAADVRKHIGLGGSVSRMVVDHGLADLKRALLDRKASE